MGGILVGNKWRGATDVITNLSPSEIGDYGYASSTSTLYALNQNDGSNINDWVEIGNTSSLTASLSSPFSINDFKLDLNVESPLFIAGNTLKITLPTPPEPVEPTESLSANEIIDIIYPIGSLFLSMSDHNPSSYWTGTVWVRVSQGRFIAGVGTGGDIFGNQKTITEANNSGTYRHTLTIAEMPSHDHIHGTSSSAGQPVDGQYDVIDTGVFTTGTQHGSAPQSSIYAYTSTEGGDESFSVTPPAFGVYVWQRTA